MKKLLVLAGSLVVASLAAPAAQSFEVASVKRNTSGDGFITVGMLPGGRLTLTNTAVRQMIVRAYGVQPYQVVGGPSWTTSDRFDVIAKAATDATPQQLNAMLQTLLADRFKLKVHKETRDADVYRLVKARADGKLGEAIKPSAVDCDINRGRGAGPAAGPMADCQFMMAPGRFQAGGQSMKRFADSLGIQVGRPVIDATGLTGSYDITLTFMPDGGRGMPAGSLPPGAPELPPVDPNAPALPTALQEQLGLKLESAKGPVEMIVIDSIDQPSED